MKLILALFFARNKEFFRDRGSLVWALVTPPLVIALVAVAFSDGKQPVFKVGIYQQPDSQQYSATLPAVLETDYIQRIEYEDFDKAIQRLQHHQLDMLVLPGNALRYWVNADSQNGVALQDLLHSDPDLHLQKEQVSGRAVRYVDWVLPGFLGMDIMFSGLFGIGYVIVRYRKNGVLKRLKATPVTPLQFLTAQLASRLMIMLFFSVMIYVVADIFLDILMLGSYWALFLVAVMGAIATLSIALLIAARFSSEELANGLLNLLSFPMILLSEVWFPLDDAPSWLHGLSQALPLTHVVGAAREIMIESASLADITQHLLYLLIISIVCLGVSAKLFRWN